MQTFFPFSPYCLSFCLLQFSLSSASPAPPSPTTHHLLFQPGNTTKKRNRHFWRWRHVISESVRFAPAFITVKIYNLPLILELYDLCFHFLFFQFCRRRRRLRLDNLLFRVLKGPTYNTSPLPMMTTFMHHSYSNDDNKHHLCFQRQDRKLYPKQTQRQFKLKTILLRRPLLPTPKKQHWR